MSRNQTNIKPKKAKVRHLLNLVPYLKPYRLEIFFVIITLIATSGIILFLGKIVKYLIDLGFSSNNFYYLNIIILGLVISIIILAVTGYYRSFLVNSIGV